jgi:hypothetical protein
MNRVHEAQFARRITDIFGRVLMRSIRHTAAAALVAATLAALSQQAAAAVTPDETISREVTTLPGDREILGGISFLPPPGSQTPVTDKTVQFMLTNGGSVAWKSFAVDADFVFFSNFHGPAGSFGNISNGAGSVLRSVIEIGGIHINVGETLEFLLDVERRPSVTSTGFFGTPSTDELSPIPLPAGAWLLIGGLGALGAAARRKRSA